MKYIKLQNVARLGFSWLAEKLNCKVLAFSLIELMISLITISLISGAFAPVITKKLSAGTITVGSFGSGGAVSKQDICSALIWIEMEKNVLKKKKKKKTTLPNLVKLQMMRQARSVAKKWAQYILGLIIRMDYIQARQFA